MQLLHTFAMILPIIHFCKCQAVAKKQKVHQENGYSNLPLPLRSKIIYYNGPNRVIPSRVSKQIAVDYDGQFGAEVGGIAQLVETASIAEQAMAEGYDRRVLLMAAIERDKVAVIKRLVTPPTSERDNWPSTEIQWLKSKKDICDSARSYDALRILVASQFECTHFAAIRAIRDNDTKSLQLILPKISNYEERSLWNTAADYHSDVSVLETLESSLLEQGNIPKKICISASARGDMGVLNWALKKGLCGSEVYDQAISHGHAQVISWAYQNRINFVVNRMGLSVIHPVLNVLNWAKEIGVNLSDICVNSAKSGSLNVLEWAQSVGIPCSDSAIIFQAKMNGHQQVVEWAIANGIPVALSETETKSIMKSGALGVLQWYIDKGTIIRSSSWQFAFSSGHLEILNWASTIGVNFKPTFNYVLEAAMNGLLDAVRWASERGYELGDENLPDVAAEGCFDVVKWVYDNSISTGDISIDSILSSAVGHQLNCPTKQGTDEKSLIKWAVSNGANISGELLRNAVENGSPSALRWLIEYASVVDNETVVDLSRAGRLQLLKASLSKGATLSSKVCRAAIANRRFSVLNWLIIQLGGEECLAIARQDNGIVGSWAKYKRA